MMKTLYAIRDRVAQDLVAIQMYMVMAFKTDQQATRYFADAVLDEKSILNKHPSDYELIKIADIDSEGNIIAEHGPSIVVTGSALVAAATPETVNLRQADSREDAHYTADLRNLKHA